MENKNIIKQSSKDDFRLYDVIPRNNARIVGAACDSFFRRRNLQSRSAWLSPLNKKNRKKQ